MKKIFCTILVASLIVLVNFACNTTHQDSSSQKIISYTINPKEKKIRFCWKDPKGDLYQSFSKIEQSLKEENKKLLFAMNGGMFHKDLSPVGLYIEDQELISPIDTLKEGYGNFYMQPNGIFYITTQNEAKVCATQDFMLKAIKYATQSGPLLVWNNAINSKFNESSTNINIRNGVGILPNGDILFAISEGKINLYNFAAFFKEKGCKNALYLDGFVSRMYLPAQNYKKMDGEFGVMIIEEGSD